MKRYDLELTATGQVMEERKEGAFVPFSEISGLAEQLADATRQCGVMAGLLREANDSVYFHLESPDSRLSGEEAGKLIALTESIADALAGKLPEQHSDDAAVDRFAAAMKVKLAAARAKGRGGWDDPAACSVEYLADLLVDHVGKGNCGTFEDVANFAMMLHQRGADPAVLAHSATMTTCSRCKGHGMIGGVTGQTPEQHKTNWPDKCPITRRNFFMEIDGVPTYGGPYDSYTIPEMLGTPEQPWHDRELFVRRFDHDRGCWVDDEIISQRVIHDGVLDDLLGREELSIPEGWQLVPVEATMAMISAATAATTGFGTRAQWGAMLAAAPKHQGGEPCALESRSSSKD